MLVLSSMEKPLSCSSSLSAFFKSRCSFSWLHMSSKSSLLPTSISLAVSSDTLFSSTSTSSLISFLALLLMRLSIVKPDFLGFDVVVDKLPEERSNFGEEYCLEDTEVELGDTADDSDNADGGGKTGGSKGGNV